MINATLKDLLLEKWLRQRESGSLVWITKEGKVIPIKELSDQHLINIVNMLIYNEQKRQEAEEEENYVIMSELEGDFHPFWDQFLKD